MVRMANEKKKFSIPKVETKVHKENIEIPTKEHYFPRLMMFYGVIIIAIAVVDYLKAYPIPSIAMQVLLLVAGLWLLRRGFDKGFSERRKEILKKYI